MLEKLMKLNPEIGFYDVSDKEFAQFGKIIKNLDTAEIIKAAKSIANPESGSSYVPACEEFEALKIADDIKNIYVLDTFGRCTSVYSTSGIGEDIYGAYSYTYDTQENSKNSIKQQAVIGGSSVNYLINGSFEQRNWDVPYYWDITGNVFSTSLTSVD